MWIGNDNVLEVDKLKDEAAGSYVNSSTAVTVTLYPLDSTTAVTGETWPVTMSYVAASNGKYRATLKDTLSLTTNSTYVAEITANAGANKMGYWEKRLIAVNRVLR
jgi:hypothetical protein